MGVSQPYPRIINRYLFFCLSKLYHDRSDLRTDVSNAQVDAVLRSPPREPQHDVLGEKLSAVLAYTDAMTLDVQVPEAVFAKVKELFNEKEVVEITATVAAYNCVSRFLVALDVGERNSQTGPKEGGRE
jgi:alkylhydroperoxidase family enzyme